ncbi:hypothetical protein [Arcobacter sp. LA11]|uniref:hypothetical protein n=1 Tax=Arcobacter sp. LA11 TaxID=1898176 RepID=UPI000934800F|nr:hypothetical protein [Arcobacter sp. LA11]
MKKLILLSSLTYAMFANEVVAVDEANKFLTALKNMDDKIVNTMVQNDKKSILNSLDNHILYFRDIKVSGIRQADEYGHYFVTLDNEEFNKLELKRDNNGKYKIIGL